MHPPLLQGLHVVVDVLEHFERAHEIEVAIGDVVELGEHRTLATCRESRFSRGPGPIVELHPGVRVLAGQPRRERALARSDLEDGVRLGRLQSLADRVEPQPRVGGECRQRRELRKLDRLVRVGTCARRRRLGVRGRPHRQAVAVEERQRDRGGDDTVPRGERFPPLLVRLDPDRAALHAYGVATDRMGRRERCGLRLEKLQLARGLADERRETPQHGTRIACDLVVSDQLHRTAPPRGLDHHVSSEPARGRERSAEAREVLEVVPVLELP